MTTHPDTAACAVSAIHQERIASARQANLIRQAQRLQLTQHHRLRQFAASMRSITIRHLSSTSPAAAAPTPRMDQAGSTQV
jgi:hypothetical protein